MGVKIEGILSKRECRLDDIRGTIAIDTFNVLYQFLSTIRQPDGTPLMDASGRVTSHLSGLFYRTCSLLERGINPVYSLLFGAPVLLRNLTIAPKRKLPHRNESVEVFPEKYFLEENLGHLGISREKLVWVALLCGFASKVKSAPKVGKVALKVGGGIK